VVGPGAANARDLERELAWFAHVLDARLKHYFDAAEARPPLHLTPAPVLVADSSPYAAFVHEHGFSDAERLVLALALIPLVRPQLLDVLWSRNPATERGFTEFGGAPGTTHGGFIPTGETAMWILCGDDLAARFAHQRILEGDHAFARHNILQLGAVGAAESPLSGTLSLTREYRQLLTAGHAARPRFSSDFPARLIETRLTWDDLVLPAATMEQLEEIKHWILYGQRLLRDWEMGQKLPPGFTSLFHGPPGTGKTLSACLLGQHCGCDVYRVDLSMIASKYIGETEKNLARIFDMAEDKNWILFFDEADALFGKRTQVDDAHDRYANQEVSFLLQRIEEFHGVVLLTSNLRGNIDDAFIRRFQSVVHFPMPKPAERRRIWKNAFSTHTTLAPAVNLDAVAERYDLAGGTIMNVVRYASLKALSRSESVIALDDIEAGIRKELHKEGRSA
jgi:hypothetical protein